MQQQFTGASVRRVIDPSGAAIREHAHDWPLISLYVLGGYRNLTECGEHDIAGPSMVYYGAGAAHRNLVGGTGFEQIEIEFDPAWLGHPAMPPDGVLLRVGGRCGALARCLARACEGPLSEQALLAALRGLLTAARDEPARPRGSWIGDITGSRTSCLPR